MQGQEIQLKQKLNETQEKLARAVKSAKGGGGGGGASSEELEKLKADNEKMKKRLMQAETAMETAASLKAKVARLEAQLKKK